jgi:hypothetical protein
MAKQLRRVRLLVTLDVGTDEPTFHLSGEYGSSDAPSFSAPVIGMMKTDPGAHPFGTLPAIQIDPKKTIEQTLADVVFLANAKIGL